jgi:hypothetical protein
MRSLASVTSAPLSFAPRNPAIVKSVAVRFVRIRCAPLKSTFSSFAPANRLQSEGSGATSEFVVRQTFQAVTPRLRISTCSAFAIGPCYRVRSRSAKFSNDSLLLSFKDHEAVARTHACTHRDPSSLRSQGYNVPDLSR